MKIASIIIGILLIVFVWVFGMFAYHAWYSAEDAGSPILFTIEEGMGAYHIAEEIETLGLGSSWEYRLYAKMHPEIADAKVGVYSFRKGISYEALTEKLIEGPERVEFKVRMTEGKTIDQNAEKLAELGVSADAYHELIGASKGARGFDRSLIEDYAFLSEVPAGQSLEGYLFPDTYRVWQDDLPEGLVRKQLSILEQRVIDDFAEEQVASGMSWHEILTLASIVEAEVRQPETRKIVAGIFLNRLRDGMRIQSDATINYIVGEGRDRATFEDLQIDSAYNSYERDGLPPGPIGNPSLSSIIAVLEPTDTDYYFFLTDAEGKIYYAKTYQEHLANKALAY